MFFYPEDLRRYSAEFRSVMGVVVMVIFTLAAAFHFFAMLNPVRLILASTGFEVKGWWSRALIPWSEVKEFSVVKVSGNSMVSCMLTSAGEERVRRGGRWSDGGIVKTSIVPRYLEQSPDEVCRVLEGWRRMHG